MIQYNLHWTFPQDSPIFHRILWDFRDAIKVPLSENAEVHISNNELKISNTTGDIMLSNDVKFINHMHDGNIQTAAIINRHIIVTRGKLEIPR